MVTVNMRFVPATDLSSTDHDAGLTDGQSNSQQVAIKPEKSMDEQEKFHWSSTFPFLAEW